MTMLDLVVVGIGGFIGAIIRYIVSSRLNKSNHLPIGTLLVNLAGAFLIGAVFGLELARLWTLFLSAGVAGALTTFSTIQKEIILTLKRKAYVQGIMYLGITFLGGVGLTLLGYTVAMSLR